MMIWVVLSNNTLSTSLPLRGRMLLFLNNALAPLLGSAKERNLN